MCSICVTTMFVVCNWPRKCSKLKAVFSDQSQTTCFCTCDLTSIVFLVVAKPLTDEDKNDSTEIQSSKCYKLYQF